VGFVARRIQYLKVDSENLVMAFSDPCSFANDVTSAQTVCRISKQNVSFFPPHELPEYIFLSEHCFKTISYNLCKPLFFSFRRTHLFKVKKRIG
jgi:hypothetical protein